ncbi:MAG: nitronate monooxygenase [Candidatus Lokiarchaeota archaeon]|nr:nitronate monooxygenase [Candidatus Lokiarchaeota archaeon]
MLKTKITEMFGVKHPIASAAMGPFRTTDLCIAVSEAGGLGMVSHTNVSPSGFESNYVEAMLKNLDYVVEHTDGIFGFNIRTSRVEPGIDRLISEISRHISENAKLKEQCLYALTSAGSATRMPQNKEFQKLRENSQIKHFHVAPALWLADKCVAAGCDGLVVNGFEGGGHQAYEMVGSVTLLQQVQQKYPDIPKIAAGGFANGTGLALALAAGADGISMGSRFIASKDSEFHKNYKDIIPPAKTQDTIVKTGNLSIIRMWKNKYSTAKGVIKSKEEKIAEEQALLKKRSAMSKEELKEEYKKDFIKNYAIYEGDVETGIVPLGQSIGVIESIESVSDIIEKCIKDAEIALKKASNYII